MKFWLLGILVVGGLTAGATAQAADCNVESANGDLSAAQLNAVYDCLKGSMYEGYQTGEKRWVSADFVADYRDWGMATTAPAAPGMHGGRYLVTYVNDTGFAEYTKYAEDPIIPVGTQIAKESFTINEKGAASAGPLFMMEKVAAGTSPETADWFYTMVSAGGAPQAVNVVTACHDCHSNFDYQGNLGYPVEESRLSN